MTIPRARLAALLRRVADRLDPPPPVLPARPVRTWTGNPATASNVGGTVHWRTP